MILAEFAVQRGAWPVCACARGTALYVQMANLFQPRAPDLVHSNLCILNFTLKLARALPKMFDAHIQRHLE